MATTVTYAQLPSEEPTFLAYLATTGEVWARAIPAAPESEWEPGPVDEFLERFGPAIREHNSTTVLLGKKPDVLSPTVASGEVNGEPHRFVSWSDSCLVRYDRGEFFPGGRILNSSYLGFAASFVNARQKWERKPEPFVRWATKVLAWVRRHTPEEIRLHGKNYSVRATAGVAARKGLKVL